jgi:hypothetical protein
MQTDGLYTSVQLAMPHLDSPQTRCHAGVARGDITPPVGIYHRMWGAATHDRATGVHRPLTATALWLAPLAGDRAQGRLLIALDLCFLERTEVDAIRRASSHAAGIAPEQVHVASSHTHAAGLMSRSRSDQPGGDLIGPYLDQLPGCLAGLAAQAVRGAGPCTIVYGQGRCNLAQNRDYRDEQTQQYVCGFNPGGVADDTVLVARITHNAGPTLATVVNYACHPTTLAFENTVLSPDYVGAMREVVESATGGPCMFLQGASGDLGPREGFVGGETLADRNGRQLGYAVLSALEALPPPGTRYVYQGPVVSGAVLGVWKHEPAPPERVQGQTCWEWRRATVELPYRADLTTLEDTQQEQARWQAEEVRASQDGDSIRARDCRAKVEQMRRRLQRLRLLPPGRAFPLPVTLGKLGDSLWLILPGEHYHVLQTALRRRFPSHPIIVVTLADDWLPGYVPSSAAYGKGIYQESIALVAAGSAEMLLEKIADQIQMLGGGATGNNFLQAQGGQ